MKYDHTISPAIRPGTAAHSACRPGFTATLACAFSGLVMAISMAAPEVKDASIDPAALRLPSGVPVIGAWFPQENEMSDPEGYKDFLDAASKHSHYTILTTTMRNNPFFPALRSGHRLYQRPSPQNQFPSSNGP